MPGPVSDSYNTEFGTSANATAITEAISAQRDRVSRILGNKLLSITDIVNDSFKGSLPTGSVKKLSFTERELRIIRFALNRAIESI